MPTAPGKLRKGEYGKSAGEPDVGGNRPGCTTADFRGPPAPAAVAIVGNKGEGVAPNLLSKKYFRFLSISEITIKKISSNQMIAEKRVSLLKYFVKTTFHYFFRRE